MENVLPVIGRLVRGDEGQDLLEYGLLATLISIFAMAGVTTLGDTIYTVFWDVIQHTL
jgi:Flp pilus assembly pilin Flp